MNPPPPDGDLHTLFGRRPRVLVVDDQPANVQALYQVFCADHQVFMATSGEQALAVCEAQQPDLVLLDVQMPGLDGYQVCARMKADPALRDIPVIFVTAHDDEAAEAQALDAGAMDFITKPINPRIVRARVRTHLTLKHQSDLLRQWVYLDGLTGVSNRRKFDERLAMEWSRSARQRSALSLLLIDVDQFKRYNDHYGHLAGDDCLRRVALALKSCLKRATDLLARYGGEEFACLLPDTDPAGALVVAQLLVQRVRELGIPHAGSDVAAVVTISVGVCTQAAASLGTVPALLHEADARLYQAKSEGRDRLCASVLDAPPMATLGATQASRV
jgi:diguanylate cyclase (GGDEF)-like protein